MHAGHPGPEQVDAMLDREIGPDEEAVLLGHVRDCLSCKREFGPLLEVDVLASLPATRHRWSGARRAAAAALLVSLVATGIFLAGPSGGQEEESLPTAASGACWQPGVVSLTIIETVESAAAVERRTWDRQDGGEMHYRREVVARAPTGGVIAVTESTTGAER